MCGRIIQASGPIRYRLVSGLDVPDSRYSNIPRRYNGAPSQELLVIRENHETGERSLDLLRWGLIPYWTKDPKNRPKPINAMAESVRSKPMFREAYRKRRCIVPVDGFFEWQATKGGKQPYAIGMKNRAPFGLAGLWENWRDPWAALIMLMERLDNGYRLFPDCRKYIDKLPSEYGERLYYDTCAFGEQALMFAIAAVGVGQILFGTDDPFIGSDTSHVMRLPISDANKAAILGGRQCRAHFRSRLTSRHEAIGWSTRCWGGLS